MKEKTLILLIREDKQGQKRVTIPNSETTFKDGDYIIIRKWKK